MRRFAWFAFLTLLTLVVLGVAAVGYAVRTVKVTTVHRDGGDEVSLQTPFGDFHVRGRQSLDPAKLGVPVYPEAKRVKKSSGSARDVHFNGGATFEWTSPDGTEDKSLSVAAAEYVTDDSAEKVRAWYGEHLPNWVVATDRHGDNARFEFTEGGYKRIVAIREKSDGTHIGVASFGEPASN